jgi:hypothetical protein
MRAVGDLKLDPRSSRAADDCFPQLLKGGVPSQRMQADAQDVGRYIIYYQVFQNSNSNVTYWNKYRIIFTGKTERNIGNE